MAAHFQASAMEFNDKGLRRSWLISAALLYFILVSYVMAIAKTGWLAKFDAFPPPVAMFFVSMVGAACYLGFSRFGTLLVKHTPLAALIAFHAFRILAEVAIFLGVHEGIAPTQLSFEGYQFDIVTGLTAIPVAFLARKNLALAFWWNTMALGFLVVIAFIAFASFPTPLQFFDQDNLWVTRAPYTLLPGVLVTSAIAGQLLVYRKINFLKRHKSS